MANGKLPVLIFNHSGWCKELGISYRIGRFESRSKEIYDALKKHAVSEISDSIEKELKDMTVKELRSKAAPLGVAKYANLKKDELIKSIEDAEKAESDEDGQAEPDNQEDAGNDVPEINVEAAE